jgi:hypothetical protein
MAAEPEPVVLEAAPGEWRLRLVWDPAATTANDGAPGSWRAEPELDWDRVESLLLVSATFEDGRSLALADLRPRGAKGHDHDQVLQRLSSAGEEVMVTEALVSTELDAEGRLRRLGIELWVDASSPPVRVAGDRNGEPAVELGDVQREVAEMSFRIDATEGTGSCELLRRA